MTRPTPSAPSVRWWRVGSTPITGSTPIPAMALFATMAARDPGASLPTLYSRLKPDDPREGGRADPGLAARDHRRQPGAPTTFRPPLHAGEAWADEAALRDAYRRRYVEFLQELHRAQPQARFILMGWANTVGADIAQVAATVNARTPNLATALPFRRTGPAGLRLAPVPGRSRQAGEAWSSGRSRRWTATGGPRPDGQKTTQAAPASSRIRCSETTHAEPRPERFLARLVAHQMLAHPGAQAADQAEQQERRFRRAPQAAPGLPLVPGEGQKARRLRDQNGDQGLVERRNRQGFLVFGRTVVVGRGRRLNVSRKPGSPSHPGRRP